MYVTLSGEGFIDGKKRRFCKLMLCPYTSTQQVSLTFRGNIDDDMPDVVFEITVSATELKKAMKVL